MFTTLVSKHPDWRGERREGMVNRPQPDSAHPQQQVTAGRPKACKTGVSRSPLLLASPPAPGPGPGPHFHLLKMLPLPTRVGTRLPCLPTPANPGKWEQSHPGGNHASFAFDEHHLSIKVFETRGSAAYPVWRYATRASFQESEAGRRQPRARPA
jgi:hypothetical protein